MLGTLHPMAAFERLAGVVLVAIAILAWLRVQGLHQQLRAQEAQSRWASNLRDFINLACALALAGGFRVTGLPLPAAFLFSGSLGVLIDVLRHASRTEAARRATSAVALALGLIVALFPAVALDASNQVTGWLLGQA